MERITVQAILPLNWSLGLKWLEEGKVIVTVRGPKGGWKEGVLLPNLQVLKDAITELESSS